MYTLETLQTLTVSRIKEIARGYSIPKVSTVTRSNRAKFEGLILEAQESQLQRRKLIAHLTAFNVQSGFAAFSQSVSEAQRIDNVTADIEQILAAHEMQDFRTEHARQVTAATVDQLARRSQARRFDAKSQAKAQPEALSLAQAFALLMLAILWVIELYVELGAVAVVAGRWVRPRFDVALPTRPSPLAPALVPTTAS